MANYTKNTNFRQEKWLYCFSGDFLSLVFEFFLINGHKTHLTKVIWPQYILICSIHLYFVANFAHRSIFIMYQIYMNQDLQMGIYSGLCWIFLSCWVQMKGLGVYYHCAQADFVTNSCPRAMGPSPPEAQGLIILLYNIWGSWGGPKITQWMKKMTKAIKTMKLIMVKGI
jgi:hypothetical protein